MVIDKDVPRLGKWRINASILRWVAIVLPILILVGVDVLRHRIFPQQLHTFAGFAVTYVIIIIGVVLFSFAMFGLVSRLQARVTEQNRRLSATNAIATALARNLRLEEVLQTGLNHVLQVMKADSGLICLVDLEHEEHTVTCHHGFSPDLVNGVRRVKLEGDPIAYEVVRTARPVVLERIFEDPRVADIAKREGIKSAVSIPLLSEGEVNGILVVATREERRFTADDKDFLSQIGRQLGMAIRNALLYDRSERRNRELAALGAVGKAVTSSLDLDEVLSQALDAVLEVTAADAAEVWLVSDSELVMWGHRGDHPEAFLLESSFPIGSGLLGEVAGSQAPILAHDLARDPRFSGEEISRLGYNTLCALPLRYQKQCVGVLAVASLSADVFGEPGDVRLLESIGEGIAPAIVNARLHQQVQLLATQQERERIAREMHDGMAQVVAYMGAQLLAIKKLLSDGKAAEASVELSGMQETVQRLYADVREGILGLATASAAGRGLVPVLEDYLRRYQDSTAIEVKLEVSLETEGLHIPPFAELQVVRIAQEALSNVRKHARATSVRVVITGNSNELEVEVRDNGQGFDPAHLPSTGWPRFGLQTMRERAEAVGGRFAVETVPAGGTTVRVSMPLPGGNGRKRGHESPSG
ncbi:MAG: GAF domain-containing sensor histidine kinase [Chloroflexi bacterium]|nr:GAF domain-containing sensor histidine kinase [Chloroflexota bacterium]